VKTEKQRHKIV